MDNLENPLNRVDAEASTSSNEPFSSSKKRKLSDNKYQNEFESIKQKLEKQKDIIYSQTCELHEERRLLKNVKNELERMTKNEEELQSKIVGFEAQKKMTDAELVKLKSDMKNQLAGLKKQNEEKDEKIKEFELLGKNIVPDPECINEKEIKINELQSTCERHEKQIKELEDQLQSKANTTISLHAEITQMKQNQSDQTKLLQAENDRLKAIIKEQDQKSKETEQKLVAEVNTVAELQFELEEMKKCYKADLLKNENDKKALKDEHDKKMADMKAEMQRKIDNEKNEHATAIDQLNATNEDLLKKISENQEAAAEYRNQIKELNDKISVPKNLNTELHSQNEIIKQKIIDPDSDSEEQSDVDSNGESDDKSVERIVDLDELCDESGICYDRLLGRNNITVIKVKKLEYYKTEMNLYSGYRKIKLNFLDLIKNVCRFQVNGEWNFYDFDAICNFNQLKPIIHSFNLIKLNLYGFTLKYEVFLKLVSSHTITTFIGGSIKRENDAILEIDEILKELPNIENFKLTSNGLSKTECKKLTELSTFSKLRQFKLQFTKSPVELLYFNEFIKKHQNAGFTFDDSLLNGNAKRSFPKKIQNLRDILPSNCKVTHKHRSSFPY